MPNSSIETYIAGLNYDPRVLLAVVPDGTTSAVPVKDRQPTSNGVVICTKIQHKLNKILDAVAILSPTAGVVYPGALVRADQNLSEGHPTPIALPRGAATLSIDLPGLANPSETLLPSNSGIQKFVNGKLEEWTSRRAARATSTPPDLSCKQPKRIRRSRWH